jgi:hypothetical protein
MDSMRSLSQRFRMSMETLKALSRFPAPVVTRYILAWNDNRGKDFLEGLARRG